MTVLSLLPEARVPSAPKVTLLMSAEWLRRDPPSRVRVARSQRIILSSELPEASIVPSGWKTILRTERLWPVSGSPVGLRLRLATSQRMIELSVLSEAVLGYFWLERDPEVRVFNCLIWDSVETGRGATSGEVESESATGAL